ncbi:cilia- and flagella-associated protein 91-like isoform X2 [Octopus sinensis]|uniref:Cilia- and flagella-associated protein 91 n=1 Tax=Octopus sinensis TaxID=2607531 RepID=A0A7E6FH08_9MOLL|nr:cilia- and flagella-associated protein 91-like isoform X2 [Octopus sinensis]
MSRHVLKERLIVAEEARTHDNIYDPVYTVSGERDHKKSLYKSFFTDSKLKSVPNYNNMYSEMRHYPHRTIQYETVDPIPLFIPRQWSGIKNRDPEPQVQGADRWKFFHRPLIPFLFPATAEIIFTKARPGKFLIPESEFEEIKYAAPMAKHVQVQTDYRDADVQTDPYSPEYVVRPGSQPEILTLATLCWDQGLPAGLAEVEMIERARAKREWEKNLPSLNDPTQIEKRRKMMEAMELKEWLIREKAIEVLQGKHLKVLKKLLKEREERQQDIDKKRLDKIWAAKQKEKKKLFRKIRLDHVKGLVELETALPLNVTHPVIKIPTEKNKRIGTYVKRRYKREFYLEEIHEKLKAAKTQGKPVKKPLKYLQKVIKPPPRPATPSVIPIGKEEENRELAVIFLQQLLRGRATHKMMMDGKNERIDLILELQSTHALQEDKQRIKDLQREATLNLQRQKFVYDHQENLIDSVMSQVEGHTIGSMFDFLSKELIRMQEERRVKAFSILAERVRRMREAEESGRRQLEERMRRESDEIFKQVIKVHQVSVDAYLEDIIMSSLEETAEIKSRKEIQELAEKVCDMAYEMEDKRTELESEEIVGDLIHNFLLPDVQKELLREKVKQKQSKYLLAASKEVHEGTYKAINKEKDPEE